jgi:hypothetical protein
MSWIFCAGTTKDQLIQKLLAPRNEAKTLLHVLQRGGPTRKESSKILLATRKAQTTLDYVLAGNTLWTVQLRDKDPCIVCYLIAQEYNVWGYTELFEGGVATPVNCPLLLLKLAPPIDRNWREYVRQYHAAHNKRPKPRETWSLKNGRIPHILITAVGPRVEGTYMGHTYRVKLSTLARRLLSWEWQLPTRSAPVTHTGT